VSKEKEEFINNKLLGNNFICIDEPSITLIGDKTSTIAQLLYLEFK
jgi:hypothetical protein